jgi:oligopeptidase B
MKEPRYEMKEYNRKHFGVEWSDPFHWLLDAPLKSIVSNENEYYESVARFDRNLYRELNLRHDKTKPLLRIRTKEGYYVNLLNRNRLSKMSVILPNTDKEILIDEDVIYYQFDTANRFVFYSKDAEDGSEKGRIHVRNLRLDRQRDILRNVTTTFGVDQDRNIYYGRSDSTGRVTRFCKYVWKTQREDLIFEEMDPTIDLEIAVSSCKTMLFLRRVQTFTAQIFSINLRDGKNVMREMTPFETGVDYEMEYSNGRYYALTNLRHKNYSIMLHEPNKPGREVFHPGHSTAKIVSFNVIDDIIFVHEQSRGKSFFYMITVKNTEKPRIIKVAFPEPAFDITLMTDSIDWTQKKIYVRYSSPITPPTYYEINWAKQSMERKYASGCGYIDKTRYKMKIDYVGDNRIPVVYFYREDMLKDDNSNPLYIAGYGAYGMNTDISYKSDLITLTERGFICAYAYVRGGGDVSQDWYYEGTNLNKRNTFLDFIEVTRHLQKMYSRPDRTVAFGRSAGGFLMGAIANRAPELYNTIYMQVPFLDVLNTLMDATQPLTTIEYLEFGSPSTNEAEFKNLKEWAPYENIEKKRYPNIIIEVGRQDPRVNYRESIRYIAKMRMMRRHNGTKMLLYVDTTTGHFPNDTVEKELVKKTRSLRFIMDNVGV